MIALISQIIPWEWLAGIGLVTIGLVTSYFGGRKAARKDIQIEELEENVDVLEIRNEVENRIARDGNSRERMRKNWQRKL